jgi:hypothetical protein
MMGTSFGYRGGTEEQMAAAGGFVRRKRASVEPGSNGNDIVRAQDRVEDISRIKGQNPK